MKFILSFILFCTGFLSGYSQADPVYVGFIAYWPKGEKHDYKITKIQQQWREDVLTKDDSTQYVVRFEVIDSTTDSYKIKWSYKTNLQTNYGIPGALMDKFSKYEMTEVIYRAAETGEFLGIENWEALGEMMKNLVNDMVEVLGEDENTKVQLRKTMEPLIAAYQSKEGLEQLVFEELQFFHFPFGFEIGTDETVEYEDQLPNFFGGAPIKGDAKLYLESVDTATYRCVLMQEMTLNPEDTKQLLNDVFKKMGLGDEEMGTARYDITDKNRYEYYYYPGIPIKIETFRETLIDIDEEKGRRVDKRIIEMID